MSIMFKSIFELIINSLSISDNPIINVILMSIIGLVAFKIAFYITGKLGFRKTLGSFVHWSIRLLIILFVCNAC